MEVEFDSRRPHQLSLMRGLRIRLAPIRVTTERPQPRFRTGTGVPGTGVTVAALTGDGSATWLVDQSSRSIKPIVTDLILSGWGLRRLCARFLSFSYSRVGRRAINWRRGATAAPGPSRQKHTSDRPVWSMHVQPYVPCLDLFHGSAGTFLINVL
jgi:hypothetical protein